MSAPPIVWSIAGTDSGGGAGLAADQRAAEAFGLHLCPVVAAVTAQHSRAVLQVEPMPAALLDAQLQALADDMPPRAIKTGLLGGAEQIRGVARWVDRLREAAPVALVVDPVLGASTGASFADAAALAAYRDELLPRATVVTPNRHEAARLLGQVPAAAADCLPEPVPQLAAQLLAAGAEAVCITGGDGRDVEGRVLDWLASPHASGWLALPRVDTPHRHGTGCTFATSVAAALARGFVAADAIVLAKMATTHALRHGHPAGRGAGPVKAGAGFADDPSLLPMLSWGEAPNFADARTAAARPIGLYAIVDSAERVEQVLAAGCRSVQLRIKAPERPDAEWLARLADEVRRSLRASEAADAELFVNDHWELARALGATGVHLGQEDLLALGEAGRHALRASGMSVGISTHSLWELCRAAGSAPRYIACGPVWPTLTKAMPWQAQGLHNLGWWRRMANAPLVAIGGILTPEQAREAAACGADGVCIVRGLGADPKRSVPAFQRAIDEGRAGGSASASASIFASAQALPTPSINTALP